MALLLIKGLLGLIVLKNATKLTTTMSNEVHQIQISLVSLLLFLWWFNALSKLVEG